MSVPGLINIPTHSLINLGFSLTNDIHYQLDAETLANQTVSKGQGNFSDTGALVSILVNLPVEVRKINSL
jgi:phosphoenolpyruvate carboxykinase (ATP)